MAVGDVEEVDEPAQAHATGQSERPFFPHVEHPDVVFAPRVSSRRALASSA
jgi:hypothetical protein